MKRFKKAISLLLSMLIIFSSLTVGFYAYADTPDRNDYDFAKEVDGFKTTEFIRPDNSKVAWTVGGIQSASDALWDLIANTVIPLIAKDIDLSEGLDKTLEEKVYTNEMVSKIIDLYAELSQNETPVGDYGTPLGSLISIIAMPDAFIEMLPEAKYSNFVNLLNKHVCYYEPDGTELLGLAAETYENGTFGFEDGDRDGFFDALLAVLRPVTTLLEPGAKIMGMIDVGVKMFDYEDGEGNQVDGLYARLIPLLEQLGCTSLPTSAEYKSNFEKVLEESGESVASDELLKPIIDSILTDILDVVSPDPMNGLIKILPRIAYVIGTDLLNDSVKAALGQAGQLSGLAGSIDLSVDAINEMLFSAPIDLSDIVGKECQIQLSAIDWMKLANCSTVEVLPSVSNSNEYFMLRTGETESCFSTVFYYVYDVLFADQDNYASFKTLVSDLLGSLSSVVTGYTDNWVKIGNVATYGEVLDMLGTPSEEPIPRPGNNDGDNNNSNGNNGNGNNSNGGDNNTPTGTDSNKPLNNDTSNGNKSNVKSPSIPNTGSERAAITAGTVVLFTGMVLGAVFVILNRKKIFG